MKCEKCDFTRRLGYEIKNVNGCLYCYGKNKKFSKTQMNSMINFYKRINELGGEVIGEYVNKRTRVRCKCKNEHDCDLEPGVLKQGGRICKICSDNEIAIIKNLEWIEKAKEVHGDDKYDYSKVDYKDSKTKVIIICSKHGEFKQMLKNHVNSKQGCPKCSGTYSSTTEEWIKKAKDVHGDKYDYSKVVYKDSKTKVIIICSKHGEFEQMLNNHINSKQGCPKCSGTYSPTTEEWIEKATEVHGDKYDYSKVEYENTSTKIIIICKTHGEFEQTPHSHLRGFGCSKCTGSYSPTTEEWIEKAKEIHGDKYDYSKVVYKKDKTKVIIICKTHGEFEKTPSKHIHAKQGCQNCYIFQSEECCRNVLEKLLKDYKFPKSRPKFLNGLELDGYCKKLKIAFEYQGRQHYYYIPHFHRNGVKDLIKQHLNDRIKKQVCDRNGIKLISIPYMYTYENPTEIEEFIKKNIGR